MISENESQRFHIDPSLVAQAAAIGMGIVVDVGADHFVASLPEAINGAKPVVPPHLVQPLNLLLGAIDAVIGESSQEDRLKGNIAQLEHARRAFAGMVTFEVGD